MSCRGTLLFALLMFVASASTSSAQQTQTNVMIELPFTAAGSYKDPFNDVTLDVIFVDPKGEEFRVPAFWAGGTKWKVRYASPRRGTHQFRTDCSIKQDKGLHNITGSVEIKPYAGTNPLYLHGPIRVATSKRHFEHTDGTPFFWLGDTWWMGLCHRLHWPDEVKTLAADRKAKGFNTIQIVAGLYPDMHPFDPRGANEAGFPWTEKYERILPEYFDSADRRILYLVDEGFSPCIVGAWGYFMQWMGVEKMKLHWRNLIARYGALPVTWCAAGEANLPWYLARGFPYDDRKQVSDWTEVMRYIRQTDPFHRPLTVHPTGLGRLSSRHCTDDVSLLDFDMLQTPHGERNAVAPTLQTVRTSYADQPVMPVINGEAAYERLNDTLRTEWTRRMFWLCLTNGAAGHTYGANGIWQVNRKGHPHGPSPHHPPGSTGYGVISWDDAMKLPGSTQVGLGQKFFEQFDWTKFEPHPDWADFASNSRLKLDGSQWIWFDEGQPVIDAPAAKRFFRRRFDLRDASEMKSAQLRLSADDRFEARLNGVVAGAATDAPQSWQAPRQFDVANLLRNGENVLEIEAENLPATGPNPAGLIVYFEIQFQNAKPIAIASDAQWEASTDKAKWSKAIGLGPYGMPPWGRIDREDNSAFAPQSTGIPGVVRITYVPDPEPIILRDLPASVAYSATSFDPVTGAATPLPPIHRDLTGRAICAPPQGIDHDWVVVLKVTNRWK